MKFSQRVLRFFGKCDGCPIYPLKQAQFVVLSNKQRAEKLLKMAEQEGWPILKELFTLTLRTMATKQTGEQKEDANFGRGAMRGVAACLNVMAQAEQPDMEAEEQKDKDKRAEREEAGWNPEM